MIQMGKTPKISIWQLFSVILLSRLLTLLTYTSYGADKMQNADFFPAVLFCFIFVLLFSVMLFVQQKAYPEKDLTDIAYIASPVLSKGTSVCYALFFLVLALTTLTRLELFVSTIVFPNNDSALFVLICILASCYAASLGIEAIGRTSTISLALFGAAFLFIMIAMADKIDFVNFSPVFFNGVMSPLKSGLNAATRTVEVVMMTALLPKVTGKPMRAYAAWLVTFNVFTAAVFFFVFGGLGDFALMQLFPIHSMAVLSEVGVFQRFDVLLTGIWILTAFIKISLLLYLQAELLQKSFRREWKNGYVLAAGAIILVIEIGFGDRFSEFFFSTTILFRTLVYAAFALILPGIIMLAAHLKGKKQHETGS